MPRRPCLGDFGGPCGENRPPLIDYPDYSSSGTPHSDLHHLDIKFPGEHKLDGESFDAEIQMFHTHLTSDRLSSLGIPIRATADGYNHEFQLVLDEFQSIYDQHAAECNSATGGNFERRETRRMQGNLGFNPYSDAFMTTIFFYRYDGSLTEPPCTPNTWWVMMEPMIISLRQLEQIKYLLFTHVDSNCKKTSVHNADQSVARPLQTGEARNLEYCDEGEFKSDEENGTGIAKKCP